MIPARHITRIAIQIGCIVYALSWGAPRGTAAPPRVSAATVGKAAPAFILPDLAGARHTPADYRGHSVVLFFFCGCDLCHQCARQWRQVLASGQLEQIASARPGASGGASKNALPKIMTVVVFGGDADGAKLFAQQTGIDPAKITFLLDPEELVSDLYIVDSCPRAFVLDGNGTIRYTNNTKKDGSLPIDLLVSRTLDALRDCNPPAPPKSDNGNHPNK